MTRSSGCAGRGRLPTLSVDAAIPHTYKFSLRADICVLLFLQIVMGLFGKSAPPDPKEQVKEWSKKLRKERNALDRQINQIKREEQKAVNSIKQSGLSNHYGPVTYFFFKKLIK